ncbi:sulfurtransferase TusA family protein [Aneurinibacillus migulanus]|uniref:sulfurtransferase TusA family protein n=1 Tax=Aneurinibacillus migulanus TaxID=47500 RepID=UPI002E1A8EF9|nr:sulfurtransferase TusA family protein [Aneurinibacillus migulanus]
MSETILHNEEETVLDALGEVCPYPLLKVQMAMEGVKSGGILCVHFDCGKATETIPEWAKEDGHEQLSLEEHGDQWTIRLRKKAE